MRNAYNLSVPLRLASLAANPSAPDAGALLFNTVSDTLEFWDGTVWRQVEDKTYTSATYLSKADAAGTYATQEYATSIAAGLDPKQAVRAATTANLTLTYAIASDWVASTAYSEGDYISGLTAGSNPTDVFKCVVAGSSDAAEPTWDVGAVGNETVDGTATWEYVRHGGGATITNADTQAALTIDTVALAVGERVLVKDQTTTAHNGIYVVTDIGSGASNWVMVRAEDFDGTPDNEIDGGEYTFVQGTGNVNGGSTWVVISPAGATIDVGTDPIIFSQSGSSPENITAAIQLELDTLEGSMGAAINGDGSFDPTGFGGTNYLTAVSTFTLAFIALDSEIKTNADAIGTNATDIGTNATDIGDLVTLSGVAANSTDLGTFSGAIITDASTVKVALQELETQMDTNVTNIGTNATDIGTNATDIGTNATDIGDLVTLSGVAANSTDLGTFTGTVLGTGNETVKGAIQSLGTQVDLNTTALANISVSLQDAYDGGTTIAMEGSNIVISSGVVTDWAASTVYTAGDYVSGTGANDADVFICTVGGTSNATEPTWDVAAEGNTTVDNTVTWAYVKEALEVTASGGIIADKLTSSGSGLLFADDANKMVWDSGILTRYDGLTNGVAEEYVDGISLTASSGPLALAGLSVAHATWKSQIIDYSLVDGSGNQRVGRLLVTTDGTDISLSHDFTETADVLVSFDAIVNGANVDIRYTAGANGGATMFADVKRLRS